MVHRAPDARLLTNLIGNEKEYAKHLTGLFPFSHAALASLSAYAAASPATPARTIAAIVDILASADDALQRYNHAIDTWREQLVGLKTLEDDLSAILRDRDILVTRLIKASKATREAHRSSRLMSTLASASFSSLPSTNSTTTHYSPSSTIQTTVGTGSSPASTNAKLAQAQAELQACEAHLVTKERELDARRISVARDGLGARCRALIDCGWVWGEMGKQGLRTLQALTADELPPHTGSKPFYTTASDNSSLTPSQSASQIAALSVETSNEGATSRDHEPTASEPDSHGDLILTLPPAHAISELTVPTVWSRSPHNGDAATQNSKPIAIAPAPRRRRTKRVHRPPSQHITEASDEGSDTGPFPAPSPATVPTTPPATVTTTNASTADPNTGNTDPSTSAPRPFPTRNEDTSSDDEAPFQIVENDPFEVIRRSMLGTSPSVPLLPVPPGTRDGLSGSETSPSRATFSLGRAAGASVSGTGTGGKRERRTSILGSLRGLFKKHKERERKRAEWDESPRPSSNPNGDGRAWVTRTDTRTGKGRADVDSDSELRVASVTRGSSRLRKGRLRGTNVGVDGWITDSSRPSGTATGGTSATGAGLERARTRRGMMKQSKTSVADLRGSEQGHTDGEMDGRMSRPLTRASNKAKEKVEVEEAAVKLSRHVSAPVSKGVISDSRADIDVQHVRAATTTATTATRIRKPSETHRRSAAVSVVDTHMAVVSTSTSGTISRKAAPPFESSPRPASRTPSPSPSRTPSPAPSPTPLPARSSIETKKQQRRAIGNGHAIHGHVQNQSLMSIVADVTHLKDRDDAEREKMRPLDVPRAPGSVLREAEGSEVVGAGGSGRGRGRRSSWTVGAGEERVVEQRQGQGRGRGVIKMPLKSALRNASRTPSPSPATVPSRAENGEKKRPASGLGKEDERAVSPTSFRDSMSVSSYATGRESLSEEDEARPEPVLTIPPPPAVDPPKEGSTEEPHIRRKSVRMSLQPTFSPSPPALMEDVGWGDSERRRSKPMSDVWTDSSSEEEAYQRGRALLNLVGKADAFKAKALKDKARW